MTLLTESIESRMATKLQDGRAAILIFVRENPGCSTIQIAKGLPDVRNLSAKVSAAQIHEQIEQGTPGRSSWKITKKGLTWLEKWERENRPVRHVEALKPKNGTHHPPPKAAEEPEPEEGPASTCCRCQESALEGSRVTWAGSTWCRPECMALDLGLYTEPVDDKIRLPLEGLDATFEVQIALKRGDQTLTLLQLCEEKYQEGRRHGFQAGHAHALDKLKALTLNLEQSPPASAREVGQ